MATVATTGCSDAEHHGRRSVEPGAPSQRTLAPDDAGALAGSRLAQGYRSGPWRLVSASPGRPTLVVKVADGGCLRFIRLDIAESAEQVVLTSVLRDSTSPWVVCNADLTTRDVQVRLHRDLGERRLVHAFVDVALGGPAWSG